jgi:hypothetical protein
MKASTRDAYANGSANLPVIDRQGREAGALREKTIHLRQMALERRDHPVVVRPASLADGVEHRFCDATTWRLHWMIVYAGLSTVGIVVLAKRLRIAS